MKTGRRATTQRNATSSKALSVRGWWEDSGRRSAQFYGIGRLVEDATIRDRVLSYQEKFVKSPEATNQDRQNYRNLLKYLRCVVPDFLATSLLNGLNRVNPKSLNYSASIGRVLRQHELPFTEFEVEAICIHGGFFEIGPPEKRIVVEHAPDGKWCARSDLWVPYVLATAPDRASQSSQGADSAT